MATVQKLPFSLSLFSMMSCADFTICWSDYSARCFLGTTQTVAQDALNRTTPAVYEGCYFSPGLSENKVSAELLSALGMSHRCVGSICLILGGVTQGTWLLENSFEQRHWNLGVVIAVFAPSCLMILLWAFCSLKFNQFILEEHFIIVIKPQHAMLLHSSLLLLRGNMEYFTFDK